jgi:BirA family transcriptional regulator, biotin operon repressor / biotin---[acetyl-CoA-carboxylase] ligase
MSPAPDPPPVVTLGRPRVHLRLVDSTNELARQLAQRGAPHGTTVTAAEQTAGRGRQGRTWTAAPGKAILCSVVIRDPPRLLPLAAGVAVAETVDQAVAKPSSSVALPSSSEELPRSSEALPCSSRACLKWPNDVLVGDRKVAGILVEGRPQEGWAVVGVGVNVAVADDEFPPELQGVAGTLGLVAAEVEPTLEGLLQALGVWIASSPEDVLQAVRSRDTLRGQPVRWAGGQGEAAGLDGEGRLLVNTDRGQVALEAGEVHLVRS